MHNGTGASKRSAMNNATSPAQNSPSPKYRSRLDLSTGIFVVGGREEAGEMFRGSANGCVALEGGIAAPRTAPQPLQVGRASCVSPHRGHLTLVVIDPSSSLTPLILCSASPEWRSPARTWPAPTDWSTCSVSSNRLLPPVQGAAAGRALGTPVLQAPGADNLAHCAAAHDAQLPRCW